MMPEYGTIIFESVPPRIKGGRGIPRKLRDSCHACASTKVKCPKEKPECSRCTKRGIVCKYYPTRRGNRKPEVTNSPSPGGEDDAEGRPLGSTPSPPSLPAPPAPTPDSAAARSSITVEPTRPSPPIASWFAPSEPSLPASTLANGPERPCVASVGPDATQPAAPASSPSPSAVHNEPHQEPFPPAHLLYDLTMGASQPEPDLPFFMNFDLEPTVLDAGDMGHLDFFGTELEDCTMGNSDITSESALRMLSPASKDDLFVDPALIRAQEPRIDAHSLLFATGRPATQTAGVSQTARPRSSCSCMAQMLALMSKFFQSPGDQQLSVEQVVSHNDAIVETITATLNCPCSDDCYLLVIMSLLVLKVLDHYAVATTQQQQQQGSTAAKGDLLFSNHVSEEPSASSLQRGTTASSTPSLASSLSSRTSGKRGGGRENHGASVDSGGMEGDECDRMAGQLVLSKLHRVQRLVSQLSQKLSDQQAELGGPLASNSPLDMMVRSVFAAGSVRDEGAMSNTPLSSTLLHQFLSDIRARLKGLASTIVDGLQRE